MINTNKCDYLIIGGGVIGLSTGIALLESDPSLKVVIVEKEKTLGNHASGRNSGVLHSGFYYSPESLKAKFCRDGNLSMRKLARKYNIKIREVGKVVLAKNLEESQRLEELFNRGIINGVELELLDQSKLRFYEPLATTHDRFIWSPTTAVSDPKEIIESMRREFEFLGGRIEFNKKVKLELSGNEIIEATNSYAARHYINTAGTQSDRIARALGIGTEFVTLPFMGIYYETKASFLPLQRLVYPVPHPVNPFLGLHFTLTFDNKIKIGPTAIPILGKEQYSIGSKFSFTDFSDVLKASGALIRGDAHDFSSIIRTELPSLFKKFQIKNLEKLVPSSKYVRNWHKKSPGIRAQLVNLKTGELVQDFIVTDFLNSTHVLNVVSPGWTSSINFGQYISKCILDQKSN